METHSSKAVLFHDDRKRSRQIVGLNPIAELVRVYMLCFFLVVGIAAQLPVFILLCLYIQQLCTESRRQRQCTEAGLCFGSIVHNKDCLAVHGGRCYGMLSGDGVGFKVYSLPPKPYNLPLWYNNDKSKIPCRYKVCRVFGYPFPERYQLRIGAVFIT